MKQELINELKKYNVVGIRALCPDENYKTGGNCRNSYEWDLDEDCSTYETEVEELDGTCAISCLIHEYDLSEWSDDEIIEELYGEVKHLIDAYEGSSLAIIAGYEESYGNDEKEVVIKEAVVLHVFSKI